MSKLNLTTHECRSSDWYAQNDRGDLWRNLAVQEIEEITTAHTDEAIFNFESDRFSVKAVQPKVRWRHRWRILFGRPLPDLDVAIDHWHKAYIADTGMVTGTREWLMEHTGVEWKGLQTPTAREQGNAAMAMTQRHAPVSEQTMELFRKLEEEDKSLSLKLPRNCHLTRAQRRELQTLVNRLIKGYYKAQPLDPITTDEDPTIAKETTDE